MQDNKFLLGDYKLSNFNGVDTEKGDVSLSFKEEDGKLAVWALVANNLSGSLTCENDKYTGMLLSTRMMGTDFEMDVERALGEGFGKGMTVKREGAALILTHDKDKMEFVSKANSSS